MAQFGRALGSGPRGRVFESPHSDHNSLNNFGYSANYCFIQTFRGDSNTPRAKREYNTISLRSKLSRRSRESPHSDQKNTGSFAARVFLVCVMPNTLPPGSRTFYGSGARASSPKRRRGRMKRGEDGAAVGILRANANIKFRAPQEGNG